MSEGYACGLFPSRSPSRVNRFLCYDKANDRWLDHTSTAFPGGSGVSKGGRPSIAVHTLRAAAPAGSPPNTPVYPLEDRRAVFIIAVQDDANVPWINVSTGVSASSPPGAAMHFHFVETSVAQKDGKSLALYADRELSAVKGLGLCADDPGAMRSLGIFDGGFHAELKDGNDFHVMEQGICRGIQPQTVCGKTNAFGIELEL